jgi:hypothetical protein
MAYCGIFFHLIYGRYIFNNARQPTFDISDNKSFLISLGDYFPGASE